ncbi:hypothetical protein CGLO_10051 [Colletotrichum gloeosporioides Cg-14]|uniref:Uncharacterized protein n=1 Tax=Colletotrichum gloeosporioides (strain Cg-14) TaxID=1237896 RepID=T0KEH9_COLGC|nr:hypothetical protein CGLO_10051 [Colletotrichum gloeosporioides Cg-14]
MINMEEFGGSAAPSPPFPAKIVAVWVRLQPDLIIQEAVIEPVAAVRSTRKFSYNRI